jgi:hypothetical protein
MSERDKLDKELARARRVAKRMGLSIRVVRIPRPKDKPDWPPMLGTIRSWSPLLGMSSIPF